MQPINKIILLMAWLCCAGVVSAQTIQMRIRDTSGTKGATLDVPVYVDSSLTGKNVIAYQLSLNYYDPYATPIALVTTGSMSAGFASPLFSVNSGTINISAAGSAALTGTGVLLYIRFQLKQAGSFGFIFNGTGSNYFNQGSPVMTFVAGNITVNNPPTITAYFSNSSPLTVGDSVQVNVSGGTPPYTYQSLNNTVANAHSNGMLYALSAGKTRVVVQSSNNITDTTDDAIEVRALKLFCPDTTILPVNNVIYPIRINSVSGSGIISGSFRVNFSQSYLMPDSFISTNTLLQNATVSYQVYSNYAIVSFASSTVLSGSGDFLRIRFKILNPLASYIYMQDVLFNQNIPANTRDGLLNYTPVTSLSIFPFSGELFTTQTMQFSGSGGKSPYRFFVSDTSKAVMGSAGLLTPKKGGPVNAIVKDSLNATVQSGIIQLYDAALTIPLLSATNNGFFQIPVFLSKMSGTRPILSVQLTIAFNASFFDSMDVVTVNTLSSAWSVTKNVQADKIIIALAGTSPILTNGVLFILKAKFKSSLTVNAATGLYFNDVLVNEGDFYTKNNSGSVTFVAAVLKNTGINSVQGFSPFCARDTQLVVTGSLYNYGNVNYYPGDQLLIGYKLNGDSVVPDTIKLTEIFGPSSLINFTFKKKLNITSAFGGSYTLKVFSLLQNDTNPANDTSVLNFQLYANPSVNLGNDTAICNGNSVVLNGGQFSTYLWSTQAATQTISVGTAGTYSVKVTNATGCFATDSIVVGVGTNPTPVPLSVLSGSISSGCDGDSIKLGVASQAGFTYRWLKDGNPTTNAADTLFSIIVKQNGRYNVRVTNASGCASLMLDTPVTHSVRQPAPGISGNLKYCEGDSISLTATGLTGANYVWKGPSAFNFNGQGFSIANALASNSGTYGVYAIKTGATTRCDTSETVQVNVDVNAAPVKTAITISGVLTSCNGTGDSVILSANYGSAVKYRWMKDGQPTNNAGDTLTSFFTKVAARYTVKVTNVAQCNTVLNDTAINAPSQLLAPTIAGANSICQGDSVKLSASLLTGVTYRWSGPNGFSASTQQITRPNADTSMPGLYKVYAIRNGATGSCDTSVSAIVTVNVNLKPEPVNLSISGLIQSCSDSISLSVPFGNGSKYRWMKDSVNTSNPADTFNQLWVHTGGRYNVKIISTQGCSNLMIDTLISSPPAQAAPNITGLLSVCEGDSISLTASGGSGITFHWSGPLGFSVSTQSIVRTNADTSLGGLYSVYAIKNGATSACDTSVATFANITVNRKPVASSLSVSGSLTFCAGDSVILTTAAGNLRFRWTRNGNVTLNPGDTLNTFTAKATGLYNVKVTNSNGCSSLMRDTSITANPKPLTSAITGSASVNVNSVQNYSVVNTSGSVYQWNIQNGSQASGTTTSAISVQWGAIPGTGFVKVVETSTAGCRGDTVSKVVTLTGIPDILTLDKDTVHFTSAAGNQTVNLTSNIAWTVTNSAGWLAIAPGSGTNNAVLTLTAQANGPTERNTSVTVTAGTITRTLIVVQNGTVGIEEKNVLERVYLYPNPAQGKFSISNGNNSKVKCTIMDINGSVVEERMVEAGGIWIGDYSETSSGVYIIHLQTALASKVLRLVLSR